MQIKLYIKSYICIPGKLDVKLIVTTDQTIKSKMWSMEILMAGWLRKYLVRTSRFDLIVGFACPVLKMKPHESNFLLIHAHTSV